MPAGERGLVKSLERGTENEKADLVFAGEHATLLLSGVDMMKVTTGSVVCDAASPVRAVTRFQARYVLQT